MYFTSLTFNGSTLGNCNISASLGLGTGCVFQLNNDNLELLCGGNCAGLQIYDYSNALTSDNFIYLYCSVYLSCFSSIIDARNTYLLDIECDDSFDSGYVCSNMTIYTPINNNLTKIFCEAGITCFNMKIYSKNGLDDFELETYDTAIHEGNIRMFCGPNYTKSCLLIYSGGVITCQVPVNCDTNSPT